jgi:uncharacterized damage-inducible protein DinB
MKINESRSKVMSNAAKRQLTLVALRAYPAEIGLWLAALEDSRHRTKQVLEGITSAAIDFSTPCIDNTIGTLLYHIAAIEADWLYADVLEQEFPPAIIALLPYDVRDEQGRLTLVQGVSLAEHIDRLDRIRAMLLAEFQAISLDEHRRIRSFERYDTTPEWVLHHLCQHEAEHRGQIMEARRLAEQQS